MTNQMILKDNFSSTVETAVIIGDLSKLSPEQRVNHYMAVCKSTGLNPLTKPFDYITLSGRLVLYARKDATDQLRKANRVSIVKLERETISGVYVVTAYARDDQGREDSSIGAVNIEKVQGDALANAMMKAETKAKRRVTLSICGLGWLDETELETIPEARRVVVSETGEIVNPTTHPTTTTAPMTLEEARSMKAPRGTELGTLGRDQLQMLIDKFPSGAPLHIAAKMIADDWDERREDEDENAREATNA